MASHREGAGPEHEVRPVAWRRVIEDADELAISHLADELRSDTQSRLPESEIEALGGGPDVARRVEARGVCGVELTFPPT